MADGKAHSHATLLGREHQVENMVVVGRIDARAGILDGDVNDIRLADAGSYAQYSRRCRLHRLDGVHDQVENDLLQLHPVAFQGRERFIELGAQIDFMLLQLVAHDSKNREDQLVDVDRVSRLRFLPEHSAKARDDFTCTVTGPFDLIQRVSRLIYAWLFQSEPSSGGAGCRYNPGQRLIDL